MEKRKFSVGPFLKGYQGQTGGSSQEDEELSFSSFRILKVLSEVDKPVSFLELSTKAKLNQASLRQPVESLLEKDLLKVEVDNRTGTDIIELTEKGKTLSEKL